jgi:pilus assembly protein FimV
MRRQLVCASLIGALGWAPSVLGLGMGDMDTGSSLNERFSARIPLRSVDDISSQNINVSLASPEAFERAGIQRSAYLAQLDFEVQKADDGSFFVEVTSDQPIKEPFLNFLVRVRWPQGQLMREYTVLLDPPTYTDEPQRQVASGGTSEGDARDADAGTGRGTTSPSAGSASGDDTSAAGTSRSGSTPGEYGPVASNETLYRIANQVRPQGVTTNQAMIAMLRANPQAFLGDNINRLREGAELDVPSRDEMREISAGEAQRQVEQQIAAWRDQRQVAAADQEQQESAAAETESEAAEEQTAASGEGDDAASEGELDIVGTDDATGDQAQTDPTEEGGSTSGDGASGQQLAELEDRVTMLEEENASLDSQNRDLKQQVEALKEELAQKEAQLEMQTDQPVGTGGESDASGDAGGPSEEAASGEAASDAGPETTASEDAAEDEAETSEDAGASETTADDSARDGGSEDEVTFKDDSDNGQSADEDDAATAGGDDNTVSPDQSQEATAADQSGGGMLDQIVANWRGLAVGFGGLMLATLGAFWWFRRRGETGLEDEDELGPSTSVPAFEQTPAGGGGEATAGAAAPQEMGASEGDDPLAQAQSHIDAGDLSKAQDVLDTALGTNPEDKELRFKLLNVLAQRGDRGGFEAEAQVLHTQLDSESDPLWQSTMELGRQIAPEHPLFGEAEDGGEGKAADDTAAAPTEEAAPTTGAADAAMSEEPVPGAETDSETDFDLSFDLDESDAGQPAAAPSAADKQPADEPASGDDDFDLDFDLDTETGGGAPAEEPAAAAGGSDAAAGSGDNDLEFDFEVGDNSPSSEGPSAGGASEEAASGSDGDLDFDLDFGDTDTAETSSGTASGASTETAGNQDDDLSFDLPDDLDLSFDDEGSDSAEPSVSTGQAAGEDAAPAGAAQEGAPAAGQDAGTEQSAASGEDYDLDSIDDVSTKLDLADAYLEMGDPEGARELLNEVFEEGDAQQKEQAQELLKKAG